MIEHDVLAKRMQETLTDLERSGDLTWQRVDDWTAAKMPRRVEPDDDAQEEARREGTSDDTKDDRREDAAAARYRDELSHLTVRLDADLHRLRRIMAVCTPASARHLGSRDMLAAQVAAEGWCISCWRDDQHLTPITLRPSKAPYYRDRCRPCGEWKAEHRADPPLFILRLRHDGRRITTSDVERALGRSA